MERSAVKLHLGDVDQNLIIKAVAGTLSESDRRILDAAIRARVMDHAKQRLEQFAKRVVRPQFELMKMLKKATEKDPLKARQFKRVEFPSRMTPSPVPSPKSGWGPVPPAWAAHYSPPYNWPPQPSTEMDDPVGSLGTNDRIEAAGPDGSMSIGGAVGGGGAYGLWVVPDLGAGDRWMFGDASIAAASQTQLASIPVYNGWRTMSVSADILVGSGMPSEPDGTWVNGTPGFGGGWYGVNGWVGVLGDVVLSSWSAFPGNAKPPVWQEFVFNWATGFLGGDVYHNYFQPQFSISGSFDVAPGAGHQGITVSAWAAALRVTEVDGYETDGASFQFLDPVSVKGSILGPGGPGPIRVTGIDAFII